jgi:hypothetical protein
MPRPSCRASRNNPNPGTLRGVQPCAWRQASTGQAPIQITQAPGTATQSDEQRDSAGPSLASWSHDLLKLRHPASPDQHNFHGKQSQTSPFHSLCFCQRTSRDVLNRYLSRSLGRSLPAATWFVAPHLSRTTWAGCLDLRNWKLTTIFTTVWVKRGICSADSVINVLLFILGYV